MEQKESSLQHAFTANHFEDVKLKRSLTLLELHRSHTEKNFSNEMFEQKRLAFKLKCEAKNIKRDKIDNYGRIHGKKQNRKRGKVMRKFESLISLPESNGIQGSLQSAPQLGTECLTDGLPGIVNDVGKELQNTEAESRVLMQEADKKLPNLKQQICNSIGNNSGEKKDNDEIGDDIDNNNNVSDGTNTRKMKPNKLPKLLNEKLNIKFSKQGHMRRKSLLEYSQTMINMKDYWVGDPMAIGSVRRARKNVEDMNSRSRSMDKVHKLIRELPVECTRNCNKPMFRLESLVSSQQSVVSTVDFAAQRRAFELKQHPDKHKRHPGNLSLEKEDKTGLSKVIEKPKDTDKPETKMISGFDLKYLSSIFRKNAMKKVAESRLDLNKKNKAMQKRTQLVRNRSSVKTAEQLVVDVNKSTRIQVGYNFDPLSLLNGTKK